MPGPSPISVSIASLTTLLAQRLGIALGGADFWDSAELDIYLRQAIREFQVLTGYWRSRLLLQAQSGTPFYDLHASGAIPYTALDTDVLAQVGYHLLEFSGTQASYINTGQFTLGAVTAALDQRREEILGETRLVVTDYGGSPGPPPPQGRMILSSGVIQIHRVEWQDSYTGLWSLLDRSDEIGAYGWSPAWPTSPEAPQAYSVALTRPFEIQLIPPPVNNGLLSLLVTSCQPYTYTVGAPQLLQIPDDAAWALPWGMLASVLSQDAQSRDYGRAAYATQRFRSALEVLKTWPCVMQAWPMGLQALPATLFNLDNWQPNWRNAAAGPPQGVSVGGRNLVAVYPIPDQAYSIALDCIGNSPASVADRYATFDLAGDIVSALLDNAYHMACFKLAGAEFESTMGNYRDFLTVAQYYAARLRAQAINWEALKAVTKRENAQVPYEAAAVEA